MDYRIPFIQKSVTQTYYLVFRTPIMKKLIATAYLLLCFLIIQAQEPSGILSQRIDIASIQSTPQQISVTSRDTWDIQFSIDIHNLVPGGVVSGAETDGEFVYASEWNSSEFRKYDLSGTLIETFSIPGVNKIRDLTYDGQYFYGGRATDTLYVMDFENKLLINKILVSHTVRALAYNSDLEVFYVNNWDTDIFIVNKLGTTIGQFPLGSYGSIYGLTYDNWTLGGPYLWASSQEPVNSNTLVQYSLNTQAETGFYMDLGYLSPTEIVGGLFSHAQLVAGTATLGIVIQNDKIFGLELTTINSPCNPPYGLNGLSLGDGVTLNWNSPIQSADSVGGYHLFRNNILINSTLVVDTIYADLDLNPGTYSYQVSAVYQDDQGNLICESERCDPVEMTILAPCDPPTHLVANMEGNNATLFWSLPEFNGNFVDGYNLYRNDIRINTNLITDTLMHDNDLDYGSYSYTVTAIYLDNQGNLSCESDPDGPVVVQSSAPLTLGGNVFVGTDKMNGGTVEAALFIDDQVSETFLTNINDTLGYYFFFPFYENQYYIQAKSNEYSPFSSLVLPTYFGDVFHWEDAPLLALSQNLYNADIHMIPLTSMTSGIGSINGNISYEQTTIASSSAKDILVFLLDESNQCVAYCYSNDDGNFHFNNLGFGTYKVLVEIVGKAMDPMLYNINAAIPSIDNLSIVIKEREILIGIDEQLPAYVDFLSDLFPNPANAETYFEINVTKPLLINISVYNVNGLLVRSSVKTLNIGANKIPVEVNSLNAGIYFVRVDFNDGRAVYRKLMVTK